MYEVTAAYRLFLELVVDGDDIVGLVRGVCTGCADAGVVGAAISVQKTFVFFTDLFL